MLNDRDWAPICDISVLFMNKLWRSARRWPNNQHAN